MKVELGAGARARPGWIAYDLNPEHADIVGDARHLDHFADGTITALRAVDVLEHLSYRDTDAALAEWARACAPGCEVYIQVPDAAEIMQWYVTGDPRLHRIDTGSAPAILGANWRLLGGHADGKYVTGTDDWRWNAHYSLWDRAHLTNSLEHAGFTVQKIETNGHPNLCCWATR